MNFNSAFQNCFAFQWIPCHLLIGGFPQENPQIFGQNFKEPQIFSNPLALPIRGSSAFSRCQKVSQIPFSPIKAQLKAPSNSDQKLKSSVSVKIKQCLKQEKCQIFFDQQQSQYSQFKVKKKYSKKENSKTQKEGRNKFSNILRCFLKYINNKHLSKDVINRIITLKKLSITVAQFYNWMKQKSLDFRNYIRPKAAKKLFIQVDIFPDYNRLIRILFDHFMRSQYHIHLLSSAKMNRKSWTMHLEGARQVFDEILMQN